MASKKKKAAAAAGGAAGAARKAKSSPYVQELVGNDDLRDDIVEAYEAVRSAVDRLGSSKKPVTAIFDDKKLQNDLRSAAEGIRNSASTLRDAPSGGSKSGGGLGRKLLLVVVAAGLALALSEDLRKKVLDALFGAEEEFEYTSTSTPASTSSNGPAASTTETPAAS